METRRMPRLTIPNRPTTNPHPMGQPQRITALQRVLADDNTSPRVRLAACLVLLFAQPVSRIVRMTTDDVVHDGRHVALRLGDQPTPVPEPMAALLLDYLQALPANTPAINQNSPWLFPGRRPSQPMNPGTLRDALRKLGVPAEKGRTSAIRQLVLHAPAPVIAQALGATTTRAPPTSPPTSEPPGRTTHPATTTGDLHGSGEAPVGLEGYACRRLIQG
jgi:hypothetical protein